jgi:hypothetical protein
VTNTIPAHDLAVVALTSARLPRTLLLERSSGDPQAAYRHLATVILRLDVASLGSELRAARRRVSLPSAA